MSALSRREFGVATLTTLALLFSRTSSASSSSTISFTTLSIVANLDPASDEFNLLNRISFGVTDQELNTIRATGTSAYIEQQLDPLSIDDSQLDATLSEYFPALALPISKLLKRDKKIPSQLRYATAFRAAYSRRQLNEVMVDFWSNHFNIYQQGLTGFLKIIDDREVIRPHAMGYFKDLLFASAHSPAMLLYLDNHKNTKQGGNENYARELLELHSLGVDGGYTQEDVIQVAYCLTGWTVAGKKSTHQGEFVFNSRRHKKGVKTVLGEAIHFPDDPIKEGERVLEILANHPATARFISKKLCRRFVSDTPSNTLIEHIASVFIQTGGYIPDLLRAIFNSTEFRQSADQKIRRPFELMSSFIRSLQISPYKNLIQKMNGMLTILDQVPFRRLSPDGYPDKAEDWINSNALINRWNFAITAVNLKFKQKNMSRLISANTIEGIVDELVDRLLFRPLSNVDRETIIAFAQNYAPQNKTLKAKQKRNVTLRISTLLLASPYYQWR